MLREIAMHTDWCDKTMSMLKEKQFEACERRIAARPSVNLFSDAMTDDEVQSLFECSYYYREMGFVLVTREELQNRVLTLLPTEVCFLSREEASLLERLLAADGHLELTDWDHPGAAESLCDRLWCTFGKSDGWTLELPSQLQRPLIEAMTQDDYTQKRELLYRYEAMMKGLLYTAGFLHFAQPIQLFLHEIIDAKVENAKHIAIRYLRAAFEYTEMQNGELIFLHPGLAEPFRVLSIIKRNALFAVEVSQDMIMGGMHGIFEEERPLHEAMCGALSGFLRPEYDAEEAAEDLRFLVKQGVSLTEMTEVLASMLCVRPTEEMKNALKQLQMGVTCWFGFQSACVH